MFVRKSKYFQKNDIRKNDQSKAPFKRTSLFDQNVIRKKDR